MLEPADRDMVGNMKTTIVTAARRSTDTKRGAAAASVTLRELVAKRLSGALAMRRCKRDNRQMDASFGGRGLQPGIREGDWSTLRELIYAGRGG